MWNIIWNNGLKCDKTKDIKLNRKKKENTKNNKRLN